MTKVGGALAVLGVAVAAVLLGGLSRDPSAAEWRAQGVPASAALPAGKRPLGINWQIVPHTGVSPPSLP
jgi:hypothetical protein